jgi:hypothetical protein
VFETMGVTEFLVAGKKISNKYSQAVTNCIGVRAVDKGTVTRSP